MTALLRKGDIISVTGKIKYDQETDETTVMIDLDGYYAPVMIRSGLVTLIAPRIDIGESVRWTNGAEGVVKAADGDRLWVLMENGAYVTWPATEVTIVPPKVAIITGSLDIEELEHLKAEGPGELVLADIPPAPLYGKVGSEEAA